MLLAGAGSILDAVLIGTGSSWPALIPGFVIGGLGVGLAIPTLSSSAMGAVPGNRVDHALHAAAASGLDVVFLVAGVVGVLAGLAALVLIRPARVTAVPAEAPCEAVPA